ncbi:hypothetical protein [Catenulispora sp. GP43]|uniref:hypothetical protein n=1 Tax=Catenulispora sp. GP43 TaxID=3156263 RepID=UPI003513231D
MDVQLAAQGAELAAIGAAEVAEALTPLTGALTAGEVRRLTALLDRMLGVREIWRSFRLNSGPQWRGSVRPAAGGGRPGRGRRQAAGGRRQHARATRGVRRRRAVSAGGRRAAGGGRRAAGGGRRAAGGGRRAQRRRRLGVKVPGPAGGGGLLARAARDDFHAPA